MQSGEDELGDLGLIIESEREERLCDEKKKGKFIFLFFGGCLWGIDNCNVYFSRKI